MKRANPAELPQCNCNDSPFADPHHKHICTGDLGLIKNKTLRNLIAKGPDYREERSFDPSKATDEIINSLQCLVERWAVKTKSRVEDFFGWKEALETRLLEKSHTLDKDHRPTKYVIRSLGVKT